MVDAAIAYECEFTGKISIMIIMKVLYPKEMKHHLLSPFIMMLVGVEVNKQPKFITRHPTIKYHSVYFLNDDLMIPLTTKGIVSYVPTRKPSHREYMDIDTQLELTPPFLKWDPHNPSYGISENCVLDHDGDVVTLRCLEASDKRILPKLSMRKLDGFIFYI